MSTAAHHINAALTILRQRAMDGVRAKPTVKELNDVLGHLETAVTLAGDADDTELNLRRMLWLVVEAAGAKVSVPRKLQEEFNPAARLHFGRDPDTRSLDFWTEKAS